MIPYSISSIHTAGFCSEGRFFFAFPISDVFGEVLELNIFVKESKLNLAGGAVSLLGYDQLRKTVKVGPIVLVDLFPEDERHHLGVLLDRPALTQVAQLRTVVSRTGLGRAA